MSRISQKSAIYTIFVEEYESKRARAIPDQEEEGICDYRKTSIWVALWEYGICFLGTPNPNRIDLASSANQRAPLASRVESLEYLLAGVSTDIEITDLHLSNAEPIHVKSRAGLQRVLKSPQGTGRRSVEVFVRLGI